MTELEAYKYLPQIIVIGVILALLCWIPVIIKRLIKKEKVFTKPKQEDPWVVKGKCIFGIILFSIFALSSFAIGKPITGSLFCLFTILNICGVKYFDNKSKEANQRVEPTANTPVNQGNEQGADTAHP